MVLIGFVVALVLQPASTDPDAYVDQLVRGDIDPMVFDYGAVRFPVDDERRQAAWARLEAHNISVGQQAPDGENYVAGGRTEICDSGMLYHGRMTAESASGPESFDEAFRSAVSWLETFAAHNAIELEAELAEGGDPTTLEIRRRSHWDQAWRQAFGESMRTPRSNPLEDRLVRAMAMAGMCRADAESLVFLEGYLGEHGWPRISVHGEEVDHGLWLLLQHASVELQAAWLPVLEQRYAEGETNPRNYAMLYDRVMLRSGRPQRYGSQYTCVEGSFQMYQTEGIENVDARRLAMGMNTVEENGARFRGRQCGG